MENCLFCNEAEAGHPETVDYVCATCVQQFLGVDQNRLKVLWEKALSKNNERILIALRMFFGKNAEGARFSRKAKKRVCR